ncbi:hypothetical protein MUK42_10706 [Musa troglodytarum]|uniref:Uncharacterized protein n=1 Tax=Musa troglodytarum TaxID=320322 RepID=A0A9E7GMI7_9LILI|nr:hypothetical protein MUK42_10706 [Musa troglodytarum]
MKKREGNDEISTSLAVSFLCLGFILLLGLESGNGEGTADAGGGLEGDPLGLGVVDVHVRDGDPDEELPALDARHPLHTAVLHEGRHLRRVRHRLADSLEHVGGGLLLLQPHEPGGPVVADLLNGRQRKQALGQVDPLQQTHRLLLADVGAVEHLRALALALDQRLRRHPFDGPPPAPCRRRVGLGMEGGVSTRPDLIGAARADEVTELPRELLKMSRLVVGEL